jgi:hypothetical protein
MTEEKTEKAEKKEEVKTKKVKKKSVETPSNINKEIEKNIRERWGEAALRA